MGLLSCRNADRRAWSGGGCDFLPQGGSLVLGTGLDMRYAGGCFKSAWPDAWVGQARRHRTQALVRGREQISLSWQRAGLLCEDKDQVGSCWSSSWENGDGHF